MTLGKRVHDVGKIVLVAESNVMGKTGIRPPLDSLGRSLHVCKDTVHNFGLHRTRIVETSFINAPVQLSEHFTALVVLSVSLIVKQEKGVQFRFSVGLDKNCSKVFLLYMDSWTGCHEIRLEGRIALRGFIHIDLLTNQA